MLSHPPIHFAIGRRYFHEITLRDNPPFHPLTDQDAVKNLHVLHAAASSGSSGFAENLYAFASLRVVFFAKNLTSAKHFPSFSLRNTITPTGSDTA